MTTLHARLVAALLLTNKADLATLLTGYLRDGLEVEARDLALEMIRGGASWSIVGFTGTARPVYQGQGPCWLDQPTSTPRWVCVEGVTIPALWTPRRARLFGCDVAAAALPTYEEARPGNERPRQALTTARRYAHDATTPEALEDARVAALSGTDEERATAAAAAWDAVSDAWEEVEWDDAYEEALPSMSADAEAALDATAYAAHSSARDAAHLPAHIALRIPGIDAPLIESLFLRWNLGEVPELTA